MFFLCVKLLAKTFIRAFSSQLRYAEFNLQVQVKLEDVITSVSTQGCYRETVGVGKNASFKITEMCAAEKIFKQSVHIRLFYPPTTKFSIVILLFCNPSSFGKST